MGILFYNDPILNDVMNNLIPYRKDSLLESLNLFIKQKEDESVLDLRRIIAIGILLVMTQLCCSQGNTSNKNIIQSQVNKIENAIGASIRWKVFTEKFWSWLSAFEIEKSSHADLKMLNQFEELLLGLISFTNMETRQKNQVEESFQKYVKDLGLQEYEQFQTMCTSLLDAEKRFANVPVLYEEKAIEKLERSFGLKKGTLLLGDEKLKTLLLSDFKEMIVPIFFGGGKRANFLVQRQPLAMVNQPQRLCFTVDKPRIDIIEGGFKGRIFEDFLENILTGKIVIASTLANRYDGFFQRVDSIEKLPGGLPLLEALEKKEEVIASEEFGGEKKKIISEFMIKDKNDAKITYVYSRYKYCFPKNQKKCQIIVRRATHPSFESFLEKKHIAEWEEDLVLLHLNNPKHCLVAQAKFTKEYSNSEYINGRKHVEDFVSFVQGNESAKLELNIPKDMPIVPVLFTSFTGPIHKQKDKVLKTTIIPIIGRKFPSIISKIISEN
jgi:hypothetical protein